jgi:hypothetical protein
MVINIIYKNKYINNIFYKFINIPKLSFYAGRGAFTKLTLPLPLAKSPVSVFPPPEAEGAATRGYHKSIRPTVIRAELEVPPIKAFNSPAVVIIISPTTVQVAVVVAEV